MSGELSPAVARRDDDRLARLQRAATALSAAGGLGLLGLLPAPASWTGIAGLLLLLPAMAVSRWLPDTALDHAPTVVAAGGLLLALLMGLEPSAAVAGILALLSVTEAAAAAKRGCAQRSPLFALFAALLACTLATTPLLAPMLGLTGLATASAMLLDTLRERESAPRTRAVTGAWQLASIASLLTALIAVSILCFLALPRHPGRSAQIPLPTHRLVGYAEQVRLGELMGALDDPTPLFRAQVLDADGRPLPGPFHYRGVVLDRFDGLTWSATATAGTPPPSVERDDAPMLQRYRFEPTAPPILVGVPRLEAISVPADELQLAASGTLLHRGGPRVHGYQAWSTPDRWAPSFAGGTEAPGDRPEGDTYLGLPPNLHPDILALAERTTAGLSTDAERTAALQALLIQEHAYERLPGEPLGEDPLAAFLLEGRAGHCELFATSLALMLRTQGIPSRVVNGFYGGAWNPVGEYWLVRHADAHAWVEAWLSGQGWVSLDPTPAPASETAPLALAVADAASARWTHGVLALDGQAQLDALSAPGAALRDALMPGPEVPSLEPPNRGLDLVVGLLLVVAMVLAAAYSWRRIAPWLAGERTRPKPVSGEVERALRAAHRLVTQRGWVPPRHLPPRATARWIEAAAGEAASPFATIAALHYRVRYGGEPDGEHAGAARDALRALEALPAAPEAR